MWCMLVRSTKMPSNFFSSSTFAASIQIHVCAGFLNVQTRELLKMGKPSLS
jgi:hypothetical protein